MHTVAPLQSYTCGRVAIMGDAVRFLQRHNGLVNSTDRSLYVGSCDATLSRRGRVSSHRGEPSLPPAMPRYRLIRDRLFHDHFLASAYFTDLLCTVLPTPF